MRKDLHGLVAVVGMAGRFPGARNLEELWRNLRAGVDSVRFFSDEELLALGVDPARIADPAYIKAAAQPPDLDRFDAEFFGINHREAEILDPQQRVFLETCWEALEDAGYEPESLSRQAVGVYAGATTSTYLLFNLLSNSALLATLDPLQLLVGNAGDSLATRVSYKLNLKGPSHSVQSACSTSAVAAHLASQSLLNGECDVALAGGVSINVHLLTGYRSPDGSVFARNGRCRAFDAGAEGILFGGGAGVLVLKRAEDAVRDGDNVHALILGSAVNNDGALKVGYTAPSVDGQAEVIAEAIAAAGVGMESLSYLEGHGTGTRLGDPIEIQALTKAFRTETERKQFIPLGSIKTNVGHLDVAAGVAGLIKTILSLEHREIPPSLHFDEPNPEIDFANSPVFVNTELRPWEASPRRAGVSSFGFGGTNAHIVLEEAPEIETTPSRQELHLLPLSARTDAGLEEATRRLAEHLERHPELDLADVAWTLQTGRRAFEHRRLVECRTREEAIAALESLDPARAATEEIGRRWLAGETVDWTSLYRGKKRRRVSLPAYPFERRRYWIEQPGVAVPTAPMTARPAGMPAAPAEVDQTLHPRPSLFTPYEAPRGEHEEKVARIWQEVLGVAPVGAHDDFFQLGGHSLLAPQVLGKVKDVFGIEFPLQHLFSFPTPAELSEAIRYMEEDAGPPPIPISPLRETGGPYPVSFSQERLWFIDRLEPGNPTYNEPRAARITGRLDVAALERSLRELVRRQEALRTTFREVEGAPVQEVRPEVTLRLPIVDLGLVPEAAAELTREEARRPFDLEHGPLLRTLLLRLAPEEHLVLFTVHHIASDGWSLDLLVGEVAALYGAFSQGLPSPLPELPIQYADFAGWQRQWLTGEVVDRLTGYWRDELAGAPTVLDLPADHARPTVQSFRGGVVHTALPGLLGPLDELSRREGASRFMTLLAAFETLLWRLSGQDDLLVGSPVANRTRPEIESLVGFFVNLLVLRARFGSDASFRSLLGQVRETCLRAYAHQDLPFEKLVEELRPERDLSRTPLFQVMFVLQNPPLDAVELPGLTLTAKEVEAGIARYDLLLAAIERDGELAVGLEHSADLFEPATAQRMLGNLRVMLESALAEPDRRLADLPLLTREERLQLAAWNDTAIVYPERDRLLHELIEAQVERTPDAIAVVFEGASLTYRELDERAGRLAGRLRELGVGEETLVGIQAERSLELVIGLLGILKAGGAYVPLDPSYPAERLAFMKEDAALSVVLTRDGLLGEPVTSEPVSLRPEPQGAAYAIFTSGSTGRPKGVVNSHRGIVNRILWMQSEYGLTPDDRVLQKTPFSFDVSVWEFFWPLMVGARLVVAKPGGHQDPVYLIDLIRREGITTLHFVPSMLQVFVEEAGVESCTSLRRVMASGEALPLDLAQRFLSRLPGVGLHNLYGPTEAAVEVTYHACVVGEDRVPIGRPVANTAIHLLDPEGNPVAQGAHGELCIGGVQVARGYLQRPDLTADRFVPDPFGEPGSRLYRTGDLARWLVSGGVGEVEYLGRLDFQVKVRGFRIELGEIEAALEAHPAVAQAVVGTRGDGAERSLVAWLKAGPGTDAAELRAFLEKRLPGYMVPSAFLILENLPLTPNGKVDRKALARLAPEQGPTQEHVEPRTLAERALAAIWSELLGRERIGARDSFFDLGGHSLLALRLTARLRQSLGVELPLDRVFAKPRLGELADAVAEAATSAVPPLVPRAERGELSFAQERLWLLDRLTDGGSAYHMPLAVRWRGPLDVPAFARALAALVARHEALRTTIEEREGRPVAVVAPRPSSPPSPLSHRPPPDRERGDPIRIDLPIEAEEELREHAGSPGQDRPSHVPPLPGVFSGGRWERGTGGEDGRGEAAPTEVPLPIVDLSGLRDPERETLRLVADEAVRPFDLARGPLLRAALLRLAPEEHAILVTLHHVAGDAASTEILSRELAVLYGGGELPPLAVQYGDYAAWQRSWLRGAALESRLGFWRERLRDLPPPVTLPSVRRGPARGGRATARIPTETAALLRVLALESGATAFMVLLAALDALLHRYTGEDDLVVGTPVSGRGRAETEGMVGVFLNTLALRVDLSGDPTFAELLDRVREVCVAAYAHQDVPFEAVLQDLRPARSGGADDATPVFQVLLNLLGSTEVLAPAGVTVEALPLPPLDPKLDLTVYALERADGIELDLHYDAGRLDPLQMERMATHLVGLLGEVAVDPGRRLSELRLGEPQRVTVEEMAEEPRPLGEVFLEVARRHADRPAIEGMSYGELAVQVERIARGLVARLGSGPDRVALLLPHGAPMVTAQLACLLAGKTYVPLDPDAPRARRDAVIADAEPAAVLTGLDGLDGSAPLPAVLPEQPAYLLYTSGSTGEPKGVVQTHAGAFAHVRTYIRALGIGPEDRLSLLAAAIFDAAVMDVFGALLSGAALCPFDVRGEGIDPLPAWLAEQGITVYHSTPTLYRRLLDAAGEERFPAVRLVVLGGEKVLPRDLERFSLHFDPGAVFVNGLGPTESTLALQLFARAGDRFDADTVPVGFPVEGIGAELWNRAGEQVAVLGAGEIVLRGPALARGYWRRPDLTAAAFRPDPVGGGARVYLTGDVGRWLPDGAIEFAGRADGQVKIRGQRVETGEVEAALHALPGVEEAVVMAREDEAGEPFLVAWVKGAETDAVVLRHALRERLPQAAVPEAIVPVTAWPLTSTGKIDRRALPEPRRETREAVLAAAPLTPTTEVIGQIVAEVLGLSAVGPDEDFFDLGGHSLLAVQLVSRVRLLGADLPLRAVFEAPTSAALAARVEEALRGGALPPLPLISALPPDEPGLLSFAQERIWFFERLQPGTAAYNVPAALRLTGPLDAPALAAAFSEVVRRHEVLRARFDEIGGTPVQSAAPPAPVSLPAVDLSGLPESRREEEATRLAAAEARRPFDLLRGSGPLCRLLLLVLSPEEHLAVFVVHHIASDGWSLLILFREVAALYGAVSRGEPSPLPELPFQFADFAAWQRRWLDGALEGQLAWWRERLAGAPEVLALPADRPRPARPTGRGGSHPFSWDAALAGRLRALARSEGATLFTVLLAGFQSLLLRVTGETDLCVGVPVAGRSRLEAESLIGPFANTLVLRGDLAGDPPFRELVARTREALLGAHAHADVPFERLVAELAPARGLGHSPLFQVLLVLQNAPVAPPPVAGLTAEPRTLPAGGAKLDLGVALAEDGGGLAGTFDFACDLFDAPTIARLAAWLERLLAGAAADPGAALSALPLLGEGERHQLLREWNDTAATDPREDLPLHELVLAQAARTPDAVAVVAQDETLTYRELDARSAALAARLQAEGAGPGSFVPVSVPEGAGLAVEMLAVLRTGAAFVPLDPEWPEARTAEILAEIDEIAEIGGCAPFPSAEAPIYAIYTSGSTGKPKGVVVPHRGVVNRLLWMDRFFGRAAAAAVLQTTRPVYDSVVWQIFWPLIGGGRTVLPAARAGLDPEALAGIVERHGITAIDFVPAVFQMLVERLASGAEPRERLASLRAVVVGGEEMDVASARTFRALYPSVKLVNLYGPTEASIGCLCHIVDDERRERVPIGRPIGNAGAVVLGPAGELLPVGVPGELCLTGRCVGLGYLGDEERTCRAFVPDPFGPGRMYRTGDLARRLPDGRLEFLGRIDRQLKVRGVRIEPGEIEAALCSHPAVARVAVLAEGDGAARRLAAFVAVREGAGPSADELRAFLRERLPGALIPARFAMVPELPLTAGGKLDREALLRLAPAASEALGSPAAVPSSTPLEETLVRIWAEVLKLDPAVVGTEAGFFELGGHSLLALQALSRVRDRLGVEVPLAVLFEEPTVAAFARRLEKDLEEETSFAEDAAAEDVFELPCSFAQERMWYLDLLEPGTPAQIISGALRLTGALRPEWLAAAFGVLVERHEGLRTTFRAEDGVPLQVVVPRREQRLPEIDLAALPPVARESELARLIREESRRSFDLETGPLLRTTLVRLVPEEGALLFTLHHIVADGWSIAVLVREVVAVYAALAEGRPPELPPLSLQPADVAVWQRERLTDERLEGELAWWRERLAGGPPDLPLPFDHPPGPRPDSRSGVVVHPFAPEVADGVRRLARSRGKTPFMVLLAGLAALLARVTGEDDLWLGSPAAERDRPELEGLIGLLLNMLVLRVGAQGDPRFAELLERAQESALGAFAHRDLPYERLVREIAGRGKTGLFQVLFALQNLPAAPLAAPGLALERMASSHGATLFDLSLIVEERAGTLAAHWEYRRDRFDRSTVERLARGFERLLRDAVEDPDRRLSELSLLPEEERGEARSVLAAGDERCLHDRILESVARWPDAVAVSAPDGELTYGELGRRARRLAGRLRRSGVGPERIVGLAAERSAAAVAGLLAILEAGGAYLPLDPDLPRERLAFLIEDSGVSVVLAEERLFALLPASVERLALDAGGGEEETEGPRPALDNLAYVIYTSGSTGRPKGAALTHRNAVRFLSAITAVREMSPPGGFGAGDVWAQTHSLSFDLSVWEIWGALASGGRVVVVPGEVRRSPRDLHALLRRERVTLLTQTPAAFRQLDRADQEASPEERAQLALRLLVLAGEALDPASLAPWFSRHGDELPVVVNAYGPTETTVYVTWRAMSMEDLALAGRSPIGLPLSDVAAHVVDRWGRLAPPGVRGELRIGGDALSRGYLGRPDLTAERFVPDPFGDQRGAPGARLYRTGDLVRSTPEGLDFLGRDDDQVKVRGFRIEPGEVAAAIAAHPAVAEAVVLARGEGVERRLVAWIVPRAEAPTMPAMPAVSELRAFLAERLPAPMVPSAWVTLAALPLTPNGKLDRRALPEPEAWRPVLGAAAVAPSTPAETEIAAVWSALLGIEGLGVHDDFFELGGHSLLAVRLLSRVRDRLHADVPLAAFLEEPTVAGLARRIEGGPAPLAAVAPAAGRSGLPLSFAQERMWYLDQLDPGTPAQVLSTTLRLTGPLRPDLLEASLDVLVRRHESLRTTFEARAGAPFQVIAPERRQALPEGDLSALPAAVRDAELRRLVEEEPRRPFDLAAGPLLRTWLVRLAPEERVLFFMLHHIVVDGWSMSVIVRELIAVYTALANGVEPELPPLPVQPAEFALWQRERLSPEKVESELSWWRAHLAGGPPDLALPFDRPRGPRPESRSGFVVRVFPPPVAAAVRRLARRGGVTPFMTLLAGFAALLARVSGEEDLWLGSPMADRGRSELEGVVGLFIDTLVLRVDAHGDPRVSELLRRSRASALSAFAHRELPFERLVRDLAAGRQGDRALFQVLIALQNIPSEPLAAPGFAVERLRTDVGATFFDLNLWLHEAPTQLSANWEYRRDLFDETTVIRLADAFERLLVDADAAPDLRLSELALLSAAERHQLLREWSPGFELPGDRCLHELFAEQAARRPHAVAVTVPGAPGEDAEELTYGELAARASRLARHLRRLGVGPETIVGLAPRRSAAMIVGVLAILEAGGAYLPVDPDYPRERIAFLLEDSGVSVLLTEEPLLDRLPESAGGRPLRRLLLERDLVDDAPTAPAPRRPLPDNLAYVIYTSGSTGRPKGSPITHRNVARFLAGMAPRASFREDDVWALFHSLSFDLSVWEIWGALSSGARLVVVPTEVKRSPQDFYALLVEQRVTSLTQTPSAFRQLSRVDGEAPAELRERLALRLLVFCGEALDPASLAPWFSRHGDERPRLVNAYGPTEATVFLTWRPMSWDDMALAGRSPIGMAVEDVTTYVVDAWDRLAPPGVRGELRIGGAGLGRGYFGRPALTAERFVPDPFGETPGARLYRTGDLVRTLPGGELEYLGRADDQVKVRGFRIELGEVTAALAVHPAVAEAVVLPRGQGESQRLVAWLVPRSPAGFPTVNELRAFAAERLSAHMVPSAWVTLPKLPLTAHGKVDRRALPEPEERPDLGAEAVAPRTPVEAELAVLFSALLGVEGVGVHDEFFALGGHSLLAVQLLSRVHQRLGVDLPLADLFEEPTVAGLARRVEERRQSAVALAPLVPLPAAARRGGLPLSFAQERMWYLAQLDPGSEASAVFNIAAGVRLSGPLRPALLAAALGVLVRRHESLRTTFRVEEGSPVQRVAPARDLSWDLPEIDLSALAPARREEELLRLAREEARRPFDLETGPLLRADFIRLGREEAALLFAMHHIVSDGWSMAVLVRDATAVYAALAAGAAPALSPLPVQPADVAAWQRAWLSGGTLEREIAWWRERLAGGPPDLALPFDRPRGPRPDSRSGTVRRALPADLSAGLRRLARVTGATPFMVLMAGFAALLARVSGEEDLWLGSPVAGRDRPELEGLIGLFVNTLVLRLGAHGDPGFGELLERARAAAVGAYDHRAVPYERLVRELARQAGDAGLFQVLFVLQNVPSVPLELADLTLGPLETPRDASPFDLALVLDDRPEGIVSAWEYRRERFDGSTVERLASAFERVLAQAADGAERRLSDFDLLSEAESEQLRRQAGRGRSFPDPRCLHERFEEQAARRPDAVAVTSEDEELTYGELDRRASRLARALRRLGVGPETIVGLVGERTVATVAGLLAILKAGGVYLPIDPGYPQERIDFLLQDSGVTVLLTPERMRALEDLEEDGDVSGPRPTPDNLAYIIYTSGSTGRPKGSPIPHRNVGRLLDGLAGEVGFSETDVWTLFHSLAFDFSVWELWGALAFGGRLVVVSSPVARSPRDFYSLLCQEGVTVLNQTPSAFLQLLRVDQEAPAALRSCLALRLVMFGGEALDPASLAPWFALHGDRRPRLANLYGITETTVHVTWRALSAADAAAEGRSPIGEPLPDLAAWVVDPWGALAPPGVRGELWIGGAGLGRGYLGRPDLTAERFVPDPFGRDAGARLYRSGDLARRLPDGRLEYLGRADDQVKIRGFRIEPGEVAAALAHHPAVAEAVVLARGEGQEERRLVAWVVPRPGEAFPGVSALRAFAAERLPPHMLPAAWVVLPALPLTPHGKVDRRSLPEPEADRPDLGGEAVAPRTSVEAELAAIWSSLLGIEGVGVHDDFFELGGHSLLFTRLASRLSEAFGIEVPLRVLFDAPTVREMTLAVAERQLQALDGGDGGDGEAEALLAEVEALSPAEAAALLSGLSGETG